MREIVYVNEGEEQPFIERAIALGYAQIVFIYSRKVLKIPISNNISILTALIDARNNKISGVSRKKFLNGKGNNEVISLGTSLSSLSKNITLLADNEFDKEKDFVHQRRSGLNHVWIKECKQKNITLLFNLSKLRKQPLARVSVIIGRMKQNAKLCKKYGVKFELVSMGSTVFDMCDAKDVAAMKRSIFS